MIQWFGGAAPHLSALSSTLAMIGLGILLAIGIGYAVVYLKRAFRAFLDMPVKKFVATLALTGVVLIVIAIVLP